MFLIITIVAVLAQGAWSLYLAYKLDQARQSLRNIRLFNSWAGMKENNK